MPRDIEYLWLWDATDKGETLSALRQRARAYWAEKGSSAFAEALSSLLSSGLIRQEGEAFRLTAAGLRKRKQVPRPTVPTKGQGDAPSPADESPANLHTHAGGSRASDISSPTAGECAAGPTLSPANASNWAEVVISRTPSSGTATQAKAASEVAVLRRLLAYYIDCVRYDERPSILLYQDGYNRTFVPLVLVERWWAEVPNESCSIMLPLRPQQSDFNCALARAEDDALFVGYPLFVHSRQGSQEAGLIVPIFCIPATAEHDGMKLRVTLDFSEGDVNADWLQRQFHTAGERCAFLRSAGLVDFESESAEERASDFLYLPRGVQAVQAFCGKHLMCSQLSPRAINPLVDFAQAGRGIHNAAVLFLSPRLKYGASLARELRQILVLQHHFFRTTFGCFASQVFRCDLVAWALRAR